MIECNTIEELNRLELYYIKIYSTFKNGYNLALGGKGSIGYRYSNEIKMKMSGKNNPMYGKCGKDSPWYGGKHSIESKKRISEASKGRRFSKESKQKMSEAHKGRKFSKETKRKMSEAHRGKNNFMYGKTHSDETKRKISESKKSKCIGEDNQMNRR